MSVEAPQNIHLTRVVRDVIQVVDNSGNSFVYLNYVGTINWTDGLTAQHYTKIKIERLRWNSSVENAAGGAYVVMRTLQETTATGVDLFGPRLLFEGTGFELWSYTRESRGSESDWPSLFPATQQFPATAPFGFRITLQNVLISGGESQPSIFTTGINPLAPAPAPPPVLGISGNLITLPVTTGAPLVYRRESTLGISAYTTNIGTVRYDELRTDRVGQTGTALIRNSAVNVFAAAADIPPEPTGTVITATLTRRSLAELNARRFSFADQFGRVQTRYSADIGPAVTTQLNFSAPPPIAPFEVTVPSSANGSTGEEVSVRLEANYPALWTILNNPGWLRISALNDDGDGLGSGIPLPGVVALVGTPPSAGTYAVDVRARYTGKPFEKEDGSFETQEETRSISITVITRTRTVISGSPSLSRDGTFGVVGDQVNIALQATPSPAQWVAVGLPPGIDISSEGLLTGSYKRPGTYLASITATATPLANHIQSSPFTIKFVITGEGQEDNSAAILRIPWLNDQYELTDCQIFARSKRVESTMFVEGGLRVKVGDTLTLAVFFIDVVGEVFDVAPDELRFTIRKADNLDDLVVEKKVINPPVVIHEETAMPYYVIDVQTGSTEREVLLEWAEENAKNEPLLCAADVDWVKDGKIYSSRTFPVFFELDVSRP
jgi:hypothetical protein